jgi:HD superfamily phosphodiesterase
MIDAEWAREMAHDLLAAELPRRWRHVQGVARRAVSSGIAHGETLDLLIAAAWLHDIGYASGLVDTGFHPIDGARYLRRARVEEGVVDLVAHHSCAFVEAKLRGLQKALEEFPKDDSLPHDELCFCDMTTSPDGELVDVSRGWTRFNQDMVPMIS